MQARIIFTQIRNGAAGATHIATSCQVPRLCFNSSTKLSSWPSTSKAPALRHRSASARVFCTSAYLDNNDMKPTRVVEHIVLLKVKEGASAEQQDAMVSGLRSLKCLQTVTELNAGKVVHASSEAYTHALHCRYMSKEDLASYANDPYHLDVISKCIVPIVEDRLALDWEADVAEPVLQGASYGAVRIVTMKPKQGVGSAELSSIMDVMREHKSRFPFIRQVSVGKNFSPARAKEYEWAYLAVFPSPDELAELTKSREHGDLLAKVATSMEKINVVDYYTT